MSGVGHSIPVGAAATRLAEAATRRMRSLISAGRNVAVVKSWWCFGRELVFLSELVNRMDHFTGKAHCFILELEQNTPVRSLLEC